MTTQDDINLKFTELTGKLVDRIAGIIETLKIVHALMSELKAWLADLEAKLTLTGRMANQHDEDLAELYEGYYKLVARVQELESRAGAEKAASNG